MKKRVLILNASPSLTGTVSLLVKSFSQGAQKEGFTVDEYVLAPMDLEALKSKKPLDLFLEAEASPIIVLASPSMSGILAAVLDSLEIKTGSRMAILLGSCDDKALAQDYLRYVKEHGLEDLGSVVSSRLDRFPDRTDEALEEAFRKGQNLIGLL